MNKEKIEKAIKILLKEDRFYDDETEIKATKVLLKYINDLEQSNKILDTECSRLEQKESILDKVTELVNKIATKNAEKYNSKKQKEVDFSEWNLALEILNIIKGGRNGN